MKSIRYILAILLAGFAVISCNDFIDEVIGEKEIIVSNTDPDAGILYKSDKFFIKS